MSLAVEIKKRLGDFLLDVSFETEDAVTGLLGASGCGKSMTLKCIAGVERPDSGRIVLDGEVLFDSERRIDLPPQKRRVGYLFQSCALFPNMTVEQNIICGIRGAEGNGNRIGLGASGCEKAGQDKKIRCGKAPLENPLSALLLKRQRHRAEAAEIARLLQVENLLKLRPCSLSGGQAQRAALARLLAGRPRLMLLDEPFSALDSHLKDQLQPELKRLLLSLDCQTIMVTHSRDEAYRLCSRLSVMDQGRILKSGAAKEVFSDPESEAAARLTGCKNITAAEKAGEFLIYAPAWGVFLQTAKPVPEDIRAVGLRAHYFSSRTAANCFPVRLCDTVEEPFEWILLFCYGGQRPDSPPLWWRMPKDKRPEAFPSELGIAPENVLLLK